MRSRRSCSAIALLVCVCSVWLSGAGQHRFRSAAPVCIDLSIKDDLPGPAFTTMRSEATRIWLREGIALNWSQPAQAACDSIVPIVFDQAKLRRLADRAALAATEFAGRTRTIYVSAPRAFQMVRNLNVRLSTFQNVGERDVRGGTLMGRAVAHELGHVLLETTRHSATGLMRPIFEVKDAFSPDPEATELLPAQSDRLAMRFSLVPLHPPAPAALAQGGL